MSPIWKDMDKYINKKVDMIMKQQTYGKNRTH